MGGIIDLSKDFELSSFHNQSPGAQKVIEQAETSLTIKSVLVIEGGKLVASYYRRFPFVDPTEPLIVHSITKSVVSLLMGILLRDGSLSSLDETLGDIFTDEKVWEGVPDVANRKVSFQVFFQYDSCTRLLNKIYPPFWLQVNYNQRDAYNDFWAKLRYGHASGLQRIKCLVDIPYNRGKRRIQL